MEEIMEDKGKQIAALEKTATEQDECILHFQTRVAELTAEVGKYDECILHFQTRVGELTAEVDKYRETLREIASGNRTAHEMLNWAWKRGFFTRQRM